ncbi:unnamed protein product, partial [Discosporangium mesarthrocarpum]
NPVTPGVPLAGVAIPLHALAAGEGIPPILTHHSLVLNNWHKLDPASPLIAENLECNCHFLGGNDEVWFYTVTVEVEARGGVVVSALLQTRRGGEARSGVACGPLSETVIGVTDALLAVEAGIIGMKRALAKMPMGCRPCVFYEKIRPFLSGWKNNPTLPNGVVYEGVSPTSQQYYGGSAAQSSLFPALDGALGVSHAQHSSNAYLVEMRRYMPQGHRRLVEHFTQPSSPSIREFIFSRVGIVGGNCGQSGAEALLEDVRLKEAYNKCLLALHNFRSAHLSIVSSYILKQQKHERNKTQEVYGRKKAAGGKGTGGTPLLDFLIPIRDDSRAAVLD